jgi:hypothetical protein
MDKQVPLIEERPDVTVDEFLHNCVMIDPLQIQEEFVRVPAELAYWNEKLAVALRNHLRAKIDLDRTQARLRIEKRVVLAGPGGKVTESMVDSEVEQDKTYQDALEATVAAEVERSRLRGVVEAIQAKRDMLTMLGSHIRAEMERDPLVRAQHRERG